jgi:hypothetical protein
VEGRSQETPGDFFDRRNPKTLGLLVHALRLGESPTSEGHLRAPIAVLGVLVLGGLSFGDDKKEAMTLRFNEVQYFHRWSKAGQNEFTPIAQEDLDHWKDMVTIDVHEGVHDGDQLAAVANQVVEAYKTTGKVLRTDSKPRTKDHPAEHFAAAILASPQFLEAAFARFLLTEGRGVVAVYSHRVYGTKAGPEMSAWLDQHGAEVERVLMAWGELPSLDRLRTLPQSAH